MAIDPEIIDKLLTDCRKPEQLTVGRISRPAQKAPAITAAPTIPRTSRLSMLFSWYVPSWRSVPSGLGRTRELPEGSPLTPQF